MTPPLGPPPSLAGGEPLLHAVSASAALFILQPTAPATLHWAVFPRWRRTETLSHRGVETPAPSAEALRAVARQPVPRRPPTPVSPARGGGGAGGGGGCGGGARSGVLTAAAAPGEEVLRPRVLRLSHLAPGTEHVLYVLAEDYDTSAAAGEGGDGCGSPDGARACAGSDGAGGGGAAALVPATAAAAAPAPSLSRIPPPPPPLREQQQQHQRCQEPHRAPPRDVATPSPRKIGPRPAGGGGARGSENEPPENASPLSLLAAAAAAAPLPPPTEVGEVCRLTFRTAAAAHAMVPPTLPVEATGAQEEEGAPVAVAPPASLRAPPDSPRAPTPQRAGPPGAGCSEADAQQLQRQLDEGEALEGLRGGARVAAPPLARRVHKRLLAFSGAARRELAELEEARAQMHVRRSARARTVCSQSGA